MTEQPPQPENQSETERRLYEELCEADASEDVLMKELDAFLKGHPDRLAAEKELLETLIPKIDVAKARTSAAHDRWLESVRRLTSEA